MVVIIGAGIVGAATAYYLSTDPCGAGTSITILDAVGSASGSSGKAGAFVTNRPPLRRGNKTDKRQALFEASFELHEQLAKDLNLESFCRVQNYQAIERTNEDDDVVTNSARPQQEESSDVRKIPSWLAEPEEHCYCQSLPGDAALVDPAELTTCMLNKALSEGNCSFRQASGRAG